MFNGPWNPAYKPTPSPFLDFFVRALISGAVEIDPRVRRVLRAFEVADLAFLVDQLVASNAIKIAVDHNALFDAVGKCHNHSETRAQLTTFLERGATTALICALFPVCHGEVKSIRQACSVTVPHGNAKLPRYDAQIAVWQKWQALKIADPRKRYIALSDYFPELSIFALDKIIQKFDQKADEIKDQDATPNNATKVELADIMEEMTAARKAFKSSAKKKHTPVENMVNSLKEAPGVSKNMSPNKDELSPPIQPKVRKRVLPVPFPPSAQHPWRKQTQSEIRKNLERNEG